MLPDKDSELTPDTTPKPLNQYPTYQPQWQKFHTHTPLPISNTHTPPHLQPYAYHSRLAQLRPHCLSPTSLSPILPQIVDIRNAQACTITGTILYTTSHPHHDSIRSSMGFNDQFALQDSSGVVELTHHDALQHVVTGVVVACSGTLTNHTFDVQTVSFPSIDQLTVNENYETTATLLIMSELQFGSSSSLPKDMLLHYLQNPGRSHTIVQILVLGGCSVDSDAEALIELDAFLCELSSVAPTQYIPGVHDPTSPEWPQEPIHNFLVPYSTQFGVVTLCTNPYKATLGGTVLLGSNGSSIHDLQQQLSLSEMEALKCTLKYCHMAPTFITPSRCHGEIVSDPMVMEDLPHLYFCGDCSVYKSEMVESKSGGHKTKVVCVPRFGEGSEVVLVELKGLECHVVRFKVEGDTEEESFWSSN